MSRTYADQPAWRAMQAFLPPDFQWTAEREPRFQFVILEDIDRAAVDERECFGIC